MTSWKNASSRELKLYQAIRILFLKHSYLLEFLFQKELPLLRKSSELLIQEAQAFSSGEKLLVRIALDLWNEEGDVFFWELFAVLDPINISNLVLSIQYLNNNVGQSLLERFRQLETESGLRDTFPLDLMMGSHRSGMDSRMEDF